MNKKLLRTLVALGASLFTFFAFALSASACWWMLYQPEEPKALQK